MKVSFSPFILIIALIALIGLLQSDASAQIGDDEASKAILANACATSGGGNAADYQSYAASLAKTLSQLSPAEQDVVFDGAASGGNDNGGNNNGGNNNGGNNNGGNNNGGNNNGGSNNGGNNNGGNNNGGNNNGGNNNGGSNNGGSNNGEDEANGGSGNAAWWGGSNDNTDLKTGHLFAKMLERSDQATAEISFADAPVTEIITSGDFNLVATPGGQAGSVTQAWGPLGQPILRAENDAPTGGATIAFSEGKLSFITKKNKKTGGR